MEGKRTKKYRSHPQLEESLNKVNAAIDNITLTDTDNEFKHRPIFIVGCGRSGTTLLYKFLTESGHYSYPSNLIARFYRNPSIGAHIQKILFDYDNGQLFGNYKSKKDFESDLGHTKGALAPSEFWYFWREYFKFGETHQLDKASLDAVNIGEFIDKFAAWEAVENKPLLMKGMILNWHLPFLYKHIPKAIFIYIKRDLLYTAQSILKAREDFYNDRAGWWSFKPAEYESLKDKTPIEQVAGQAYYTTKAVEAGLAKIPSESIISLSYADFCKDPRDIIKKINNLSDQKIELVGDSPVFENRNIQKLTDQDFNSLALSLEELTKQRT